MLDSYSAGLYIRLSREDDTKQEVSESIINQKSFLLQYVQDNNLDIYDIYIDDGYSGTNFDRPSFKRMINDIELGRINMVITKDMSRLGRDYIGTGNLIEKYFPEHNVRYVAVNDNIDTYISSSSNDIAPFKAIINDMYARDISKKIKSSLKAKMKDGKWVGCRVPFGYRKDINDKNHLVVNEIQAEVVRRIFSLCLRGLSFFKIAKQLTSEGIKTPAQYYDFEWRGGYDLKYGKWHSKTIKDILTNRVYVGDMVQNRRSKVNYKVKNVIRNNPEDYIIVKNTHEAIIDNEVFDEVQKRIPKNKGRNDKKEVHLLDGLLYCGDCGHRISILSRRKKDNRCYTICNYYRTYMNKMACTTHSNNYDELEKAIIDTLICICLNCVNKDKVRNKILNALTVDNSVNIKRKLEILSKDISQINDNLDFIYIDKINSKINEKQFERIKTKLENELRNKQKRYDMLTNNINNSIYEDIDKYIRKFLTMKNLSRELVINLIDKIEIFADKSINIMVRFNK